MSIHIHNCDSNTPVEGQTWTKDEMLRDFEPISFAAPFMLVQRKSDGKKGSLEFKHQPRIYFNWSESS